MILPVEIALVLVLALDTAVEVIRIPLISPIPFPAELRTINYTSVVLVFLPMMDNDDTLPKAVRHINTVYFSVYIIEPVVCLIY